MQQRAYEETKAVFGPLRERIDEAMRNLERLLLVGASFSFPPRPPPLDFFHVGFCVCGMVRLGQWRL